MTYIFWALHGYVTETLQLQLQLPLQLQDEESQSWLTSPEPRGAGADAHDAVEQLTEMYDEALAHTMRTVCAPVAI